MAIRWHRIFVTALLLSLVASFPAPRVHAAEIKWQQLSSKKGELPVPGESTQQTGSLVVDLDHDGVNDFVLSFRAKAPVLVWYRRSEKGWNRYVIEKEFLPLEAGGAFYDIDGDGDLDLVWGNDWQGPNLWWWENPFPNFDPNVPWKRHVIKNDGQHQHHDQVFGDFKGTGKPQLVFWNQQAKTLFLAEIPNDPKAGSWPREVVFNGEAGDRGDASGAFKYAEGASAFDIDQDGRADLLAGNYWFKHLGGTNWLPVKVGTIGGRIKAGFFKRGGKYPQIVIAPGDGSGELKWYECTGSPTNGADWIGHALVEMVHGHTLEIGDVDGDGKLDIFTGEMAKWVEKNPEANYPNAKGWIFFGDGRGNFRKTEVTSGFGWHEGRLADLDGDGDLDLLAKPYNWDAPRVDVFLNNGTGPRRRVGTGRSFKGPLGLQLYSLRHHFQKNVPLAIEHVREFGFVEVEGGGNYGYGNERFRKMLDAAGLHTVSVFADYKKLRDDPASVIKTAHDFGARFVVVGWIPHEKGKFNEQNCREAIRVFNDAGKKLKAAGLRFAYHPHGYEFQPFGKGTLFDLLVAETKPEFVSFEMDVFWVAHGGADPVKLLNKYGRRFALMHVKDWRKGAVGNLTGSAPDADSVTIGTGQVNWPAVLQAARRAGVQHYFIEDEAVEAIEQIPQSLKYLESVKW
ncbi:MAG: sugar phosphate isomerase/epimerase [Verrucomicrobia bacterium]|nr:sugar phosphate isomerase/epimerase [Verrucomicrobiota bacterium]